MWTGICRHPCTQEGSAAKPHLCGGGLHSRPCRQQHGARRGAQQLPPLQRLGIAIVTGINRIAGRAPLLPAGCRPSAAEQREGQGCVHACVAVAANSA